MERGVESLRGTPGALLASWGLGLVLVAPASAALVVEAVGPAAAGVEVGDVLQSWESVVEPSRRGDFVRWFDVDLLDLEETSRGAVRVRLSRNGATHTVDLPPLELEVDARPEMPGEVLEHVRALLARPGESGAPEALARAVAGVGGEAESWALARLAEARGEDGDWESARAAWAAAADALDGPVAGELLRQAAEAARREGALGEAERLLGEALTRWGTAKVDELAASAARIALGDVQARRHEYEASRRTLGEACATLERLAPSGWLLASCINNQGVLAGRAGDLGLAEARLLDALEIVRALGDSGKGMLANLGVVSRLRGDLERAALYTEQSLEIYRREGGSSVDIGGKMMNLGNILADRGETARAVGLFTQALEIMEATGREDPETARLFFNRGKALRLLGDLDRADADLARARRLLAFDEPASGIEASIVQEEGELHRLRGELGEAIESLREGLAAQARFRPDTVQEAQAAASLARAQWDAGDAAGAEASFRRAIGALERQQQRLGGGDRGLVAFRTKQAPIYREYQRFLVETGRSDVALEFYERSRAQSLRVLLGGRELDWPTEGLGKLAPDRDALRHEIEEAYDELAALPADAVEERAAQRRRVEELHAARDALSARIYEASERVRAIEVPPALAPEELERRLTSGSLVLGYSVGEEESILYVVGAGGPAEAHVLAVGREALSREVKRWADRVTGAGGEAELRARSERLSDLLLAPAVARIRGADRLIVLPDGPLYGLSFAALPVPSDAEGRYLLELVPVARAVSASVYLSGRAPTRRKPSQERVVVLADPTTPVEAVARYRRELGRLVAARREARAVGELFGGRCRVLLGAEATEEAARRELPGADLIHVASHALVDEVLPMDSALVLSPSGEGNGLLHAWEIVEDLHLHADLAVLSACQTAVGGDRAGEGIVGLVRALQIAGARQVLATLWNVNDESTAELMERFYRHLTAGAEPAEALRLAQLDLLRGPVTTERDGVSTSVDLSHPRYWAPFVLVGGSG